MAKLKPVQRQSSLADHASTFRSRNGLPITTTVETPNLLIDGPTDGQTVVLAHGAGLPMDAPFMDAFATGFSSLGIRVVRFEFPYMHHRRETGDKRPPDRAPILKATWRSVIDQLGTPSNLVIGGKSMGGRLASMIADDVGARGLLCLGYPFHPAGRPRNPRIQHLESISTPTLIIQGERDPMGNRADLAGYPLAPTIQLHWIEDGEHSFIPRKHSGRTEQQNLSEAVNAATAFVTGLG
jgi:uncharacterized protein